MTMSKIIRMLNTWYGIVIQLIVGFAIGWFLVDLIKQLTR
jgi:uncharacterized membrane-anchored protein YhcB (DUF1043 family)